MNPYKIINQYRKNPNGNSLEGKKALVNDLVEFMSEKQLDNIINSMETKYDPKKLEGGQKKNE